MGREIRKVPSDWEHPKWEGDDIQYEYQRGAYHPLFNQDYESACLEWYASAAAFKPEKNYRFFHEYAGDPPDGEYYRSRKWSPEEATHFQVYETVSEGTPVTPHFETKEELVRYLVEHGDFGDQKRGVGGWKEENARGFVEREFACSMILEQTSDGCILKMARDQ